MNDGPGKCGKGTQVDETLSRGTAKEYFVAGVEKEAMVNGLLERGSSEMQRALLTRLFRLPLA